MLLIKDYSIKCHGWSLAWPPQPSTGRPTVRSTVPAFAPPPPVAAGQLTVLLAAPYFEEDEGLQKVVDIAPSMGHWTLAMMNASVHDVPEAIRWGGGPVALALWRWPCGDL